MRHTPFRHPAFVLSTVTALLLGGCGDDDDTSLPQLAAASGAPLANCATLASGFGFANTTIASAETVAAGTATWGSAPIAEHCLVKGEMYRRTSPQDGQSYAIGFEMRLPKDWNGRFFYQANGGIDGVVWPRTGPQPRRQPSDALQQGFAVISSDAGHTGQGDLTFGIDFQARLDYGYQAVAKLTPMAKALIATAYGKGPDRSYIGGCSNGGRHTMVATTRMPGQYDGYLAGAPGYRLPLAAIANIDRLQHYRQRRHRPGRPEQRLHRGRARAAVGMRCSRKCDALDGATDGMIQDVEACRAAFDIAARRADLHRRTRRQLPVAAAQKTAYRADVLRRDSTAAGKKFYASFPYDAGHNAADSSFWRFIVPQFIDSGATAFIWGVPPADPLTFEPPVYALTVDNDTKLTAVSATNATYTESGLSFMQPVEPTNLATLKNRGAKVMVYHGVSDAIFSVDDTDDLVRRPAHGQRRQCVELRAFLPRSRHVALRPRSGDRPVRHADAHWSTGSRRARRPRPCAPRCAAQAMWSARIRTCRPAGRPRAAARCARIRRWRV